MGFERKKKSYITKLQDELKEAQQQLENYKVVGDSPFKEIVLKWKDYKKENQDRSLIHFLDWCADHE